MTDMACSGVIHSSRGARERTFRLVAEALPFLTGGRKAPGWINWPILLSTAETVWHTTEELHAAALDPPVESSEIGLAMKPLLQRLTRARWAPAIPATQPRQGIAQLLAFQAALETAAA